MLYTITSLKKYRFMSRQTIGFFAVISLVISAQIGSGILMLPVDLAPFGIWGQFSWVFAAGGATILALIFAKLCMSFPVTGGPHVYVREAFGDKWCFVAAWVYWITSWSSTTALIVSIGSYLIPLINPVSPPCMLFIQISIIGLITLLNIRGVRTAGYCELFFTVMKITPFILIPILGYSFCHTDYITIPDPTVVAQDQGWGALLMQASLLAMWSFIGLESATTPAGSVKNPRRTIPRAVILGTILVALIYISNSLVISMLIKPHDLLHTSSPYSVAAKIILGGNFEKAIAFCAVIGLIGTINSWVLTSSQVAYGAAQGGIFPKFFGRINRFEAPYIAILISSFGMIPFLVALSKHSFAKQFNTIISISVISLLLVYLACVFSYLKLLSQKRLHHTRWWSWVIGILGLGFSLWGVIYGTLSMWGVEIIIFFGFIFLTGLGVYLYDKSKF